MQELSAGRLAAMAGASEAEIDRMVGLGIISPQGRPPSFRPADIQKIRLALACDEGGLPMEGIAASIAEGRLSFGFLDAIWYRRFPPLSAHTAADAARGAGIAPDVLFRILDAFGYPGRGPQDRLREDELELTSLIGLAFAGGVADEAELTRLGRAMSGSLRRIARAENEIYHNNMELPLLRAGWSQLETMERASELSEPYTEPLERTLMAAYRRQQELATIEHLVDHIESALEESGLYEGPELPAAMCFLDLEGYTRFTEEQGDERAAHLADTLAGLVERRTREHRGQAVKWLGDGVMSYFRDPGGAVTAALELVEDLPRAGLPRAHVGVAAGPVVVQGGDYFGRTVNTASRISAYAQAGQVLVDDAVAEVPPPPGVAFREVGRVELKGLLKPISLFEARRT